MNQMAKYLMKEVFLATDMGRDQKGAVGFTEKLDLGI